MTKESLELIHYQLDLQLDSILEAMIVETVKKLPDEVYDYIQENIQFEKVLNSVIPRKELKAKFIIFLMKNASEFTIAHEIAHAYLKHERHVDLEISKRQEKEANKLARKWLKS